LQWIGLTGWLVAGWSPAAGSGEPADLAVPSLREAVESHARVVTIHDAQATALFQPRPDRVRVMVERGLTNLTGRAPELAAWQSLVSTQDTVGIKVFASPDPGAGTRLAVVTAVVEGLLRAGLPTNQIIVWDKQLSDLREAGFLSLVSNLHIRVEAAMTAGYDEKVFYEDPLLGKLVFGDHEFGRTDEGIGRKSFVTKLVTRDTTKTILISPLLNHNRAGVCGNLYSLAQGSVDNMMRFEADPARLAAAVPEICALPELGDRVVLCVVDALICQYQGEQRGLLHYSAVLNELRFGRDPVALDVLSLQELARQRERAKIRTGFANIELYQNAAVLQIGISNPTDIFTERFE
jgi:hypothetical protein